MPNTLTRSSLAVVTALILLTALAWLGPLDRYATAANQANLERSLVTFAAARGLNAIISVAQGTEIAVQPIGVGVTLTVGEALDPLNDLIERFSWLVLLAAAALGTQSLLIEIGASAWLNSAVTLSALGLAMFYLYRPAAAWTPLRNFLWAVVFLRFIFAAVGALGGLIDEAFIVDKQTEAIAALETTSATVEQLEAELPESSLLERMRSSVSADGIRGQLDAIKDRVEKTIGEVITLISTFLLQTLVFPAILLFAAYVGFRRITR